MRDGSPLRLKRKQGGGALRDRRERMPSTFFGSSRVCYLIDVVDEFGAATSIDTIDGVSVDGDKRVYNLNGQIVGTGASKLGNGMYVTNGKPKTDSGLLISTKKLCRINYKPYL